MNYQDFSYFCFHTPFSKQVQKTFYSLLLTDIEQSHKDQKHGRYPPELVSQLAANQFKNDAEANKLLMKHFGGEWRDKCEIGLALSKQLGNIYTGSLYLGMLSLICN